MMSVLPPAHPRSSLHVFLQGMLSRRVEIVPHTTAAEETPRPTLEDNRLALPGDFWPGPAQDTLCRAAAAHALAHWRYSPAAQPLGKLTPTGQRVANTIEDARVEALLLRDYPGLRALWLPWHDVEESSGLGLDAMLARLARALFDNDYPDGNFWVNKARTLFNAQRNQLDNYPCFRSLAAVLANDLGQMRVRFEPDRGQSLRYRDDGNWLWELDIETLVNEANESSEHNSKGSDNTVPGAASEIPAEHDDVALPQAQYTYPEWNYRLAREHPCWSTVLECPPVLGPLDAALRERIAADHPVRAPRRRPLRVTRPAVIRRRHLQDEGDTLDINATIDLRVALSRKLPPDLRVFSAIRPSPQETSVLILLDLSASTDLHAAAQEKRAACQLGERLDDEHHRVAIHGFCSDGRHQVFYHCFKAFDAPFDDACRDRLLRARSSLSTRLGAALRHATTQMLAELPRRAKILLIGDGEPADIDVFDPRYLPADAAHAAHTARRRGIDVLALSFSSGAAISGTAGNAATGEKEGDALQMRSHIYGATTFSAAMERAYAFIGH